MKGSEPGSDRIRFYLEVSLWLWKAGIPLRGYVVVQVRIDGGDKRYPGGGCEKCLLQDMFLKVESR